MKNRVYTDYKWIDLGKRQLRIEYSYVVYPGRWSMANGDPGYPDEYSDPHITEICDEFGGDFEPVLNRFKRIYKNDLKKCIYSNL